MHPGTMARVGGRDREEPERPAAAGRTGREAGGAGVAHGADSVAEAAQIPPRWRPPPQRRLPRLPCTVGAPAGQLRAPGATRRAQAWPLQAPGETESPAHKRTRRWRPSSPTAKPCAAAGPGAGAARAVVLSLHSRGREAAHHREVLRRLEVRLAPSAAGPLPLVSHCQGSSTSIFAVQTRLLTGTEAPGSSRS